MPPQAPNTKSQTRGFTHLFELLRPELVKKSPTALSSDAFCGFGNSDPQAEQHNQEVTQTQTQTQPLSVTNSTSRPLWGKVRTFLYRPPNHFIGVTDFVVRLRMFVLNYLIQSFLNSLMKTKNQHQHQILNLK